MSCPRLTRFFWGACALFLLVRPVSAQNEPPIPSEKDLETAWEKQRSTFYKLANGELPAGTKEAKDAAAASAKWHIYRVNLKFYKDDPKRMETQVFDQLDDIVNRITNKNVIAKNREFANVFATELAVAAGQVLKFPMDNPENRSGLIYLGQTFPRMAKIKQDAVTDFLVSVVADPNKHDAVKHYALKGLAECPPALPYLPTADKKSKAVAERRTRELARVKVLTDFLERPAPAKASPPEIEAFRFIRRECVKALGAVGIPAVDVSERGKVQGVVVYPLLRVLADPKGKNALDPPAAPTERFEAAVALANLRFGDIVDPHRLYQPDVVAYRVGKAVVEFTDAYFKDFGKFGVKGVKPAVFWKGYARTFWDRDYRTGALEKFLMQSKDLPGKTHANFKPFVDAAKPVLELMYNHNQIEPLNPASINALRPNGKTGIFQGVPGPDFVE